MHPQRHMGCSWVRGCGLGDRLSLAGQAVNFTTDEFLHVRFTANHEVIANLRELVSTLLCCFQRKRFHRPFVDQHNASAASGCSSGTSALYLS
jgi:hypothetical protein